MKLRSFICICILLLLFSCKKENKIEYLIAGENYKYWQLVDQCNTSKTTTIYKFTRSGKWETYKKYANGKFSKEESSDISFDAKWHLTNDSTIQSYLKYKILAIHDNIFVLESKYMITLIPPHDSMLRTTYRYNNEIQPKLKVDVIKLH